MRQHQALVLSVLLGLSSCARSGGGGGSNAAVGSPASETALEPVPLTSVALSDTFWAPRLETNRTASLPLLLQSFVDNGNLDNFPKAAHLMGGTHQGFLWADSDVYKTLEGAAYAIALHPDAALEQKLESAVANIAAAQRADGYVNTYFQLAGEGRLDGGRVETRRPWEDLIAMHEDYCAGHLIEAALAHRAATGRDVFLDVARRLAAHMSSIFGNGRRSGVPGHQEAELALLKLWRHDGRASDFDLARFYLDERGRHSGGRTIYGEYCQDLTPLRAQTEPLGHGVRGPYMYAAAVDLAGLTNDAALLETIERLWTKTVERKMYVTGGFGHSLYNEGFGPDYDLPNDLAYNETCAAAAMVLWTQRLANLRADARYTDVLERVLYNGFASGRSLDGRRLYYNNLMARRSPRGRFGIACCATNTARLTPQVPGFQYAVRPGAGVWVHLYAAGQAEIPWGSGGSLRLVQQTNYPWDGNIRITVTPTNAGEVALHLRIPEWAVGATATVNGQPVAAPLVKGYLPISRTWQAGDVIQLDLPMAIRRVTADPRVWADRGRVALQRGPIVYCLEEIDHSVPVDRIVLPAGAVIRSEHRSGLLGGVTVLLAQGVDAATGSPVNVTAIPYGAWDNRPLAPRSNDYDWSHDGAMTVWIPETSAVAGPDRGRVGDATVSWSFKNGGDTGAALNDGLLPKDSNDQTIPRFTWWSHQGTEEWIAYEFPQPLTVWRSDLFWFSDASAGGGCDFPQTFRHEYWDGGAWRPVQLDADYANAADLYSGGHFTIVRFAPVTTTRIRLVVQLRPGKSGGLLEWRLPE